MITYGLTSDSFVSFKYSYIPDNFNNSLYPEVRQRTLFYSVYYLHVCNSICLFSLTLVELYARVLPGTQ